MVTLPYDEQRGAPKSRSLCRRLERTPRLAEQAQHVLRQGIGLGEHRGAGLLQNLRAGQVGGLGRKVSIENPAARGREVLGRGLQVAHRGFETRLQRTEAGTLTVDQVQRGIYGLERVGGVLEAGDVEAGDRVQLGIEIRRSSSKDVRVFLKNAERAVGIESDLTCYDDACSLRGVGGGGGRDSNVSGT